MSYNQHPFAVQVNEVCFHYLTPQKSRLHPQIPINTVRFEKKVALDHVSLTMAPGRITALLGKNGSGKTTLIKIITGIRYPQAGNVLVFGESPEKMRSRMGFCLGGTLIYHRLSARENLEYFGRLYGVKNLNARISELADWLGFTPHLDQIVETFSFGMKAKLAIARSMIHSPDILILDEPTLGIDFQLARQIRNFIKELSCSVLLTTHYMEEAEELAHDICIIDKGKILGLGAKENIIKQFGSTNLAEAFSSALEAPRSLVEASA